MVPPFPSARVFLKKSLGNSWEFKNKSSWNYFHGRLLEVVAGEKTVCQSLDLIRNGCNQVSVYLSTPPRHPSMSHADRHPNTIILTHQLSLGWKRWTPMICCQGLCNLCDWREKAWTDKQERPSSGRQEEGFLATSYFYIVTCCWQLQ